MSDETTLWSWRATRLHDEFDASFATPPPPRAAVRQLLLLDVGGDACAVPLDQCAAVQRSAAITPLPARRPSFRGVMPVRGAILPLYDLAMLLGIDAGGRPSDYAIVSAGRQRVAFAVRAVQAYAEIDGDALQEGAAVVTVSGETRRLIDLPRVLDAIEQEARDAGPTRSER